MADMFFMLRMVVFTFIIVVIMQIKIGPATLEQHSQEWLHSSSMVTSLQGVAEGAVKVLTQGYKSAANALDINISKVFRKEELPGGRLANIGIKTSDAPIHPCSLCIYAISNAIGESATVTTISVRSSSQRIRHGQMPLSIAM